MTTPREQMAQQAAHSTLPQPGHGSAQQPPAVVRPSGTAPLNVQSRTFAEMTGSLARSGSAAHGSSQYASQYRSSFNSQLGQSHQWAGKFVT